MTYQQSIEEFEKFLQASAPKIGETGDVVDVVDAAESGGIGGFYPHFTKAFWEMLAHGGKRFRPNLLLAVVAGARPLMLHNAFLPALALECLHTYSLIHDDLPCMDNAPLRRGKPTLHTIYGETNATLVGDGLNTYAFYLLSIAKLDSSVKVALIRELAESGGIGGMIIGQALDCAFENRSLPLEQLQTIHINKTAKLIAASLKMGALIANLSQNLHDELGAFGLRLGLYFQIRDDVIDAVQEEAQAGKPTRNDGEKNSYVNLLGLTKAQKLLETEASALNAQIASFPQEIARNLSWLLQGYFTKIA